MTWLSKGYTGWHRRPPGVRYLVVIALVVWLVACGVGIVAWRELSMSRKAEPKPTAAPSWTTPAETVEFSPGTPSTRPTRTRPQAPARPTTALPVPRPTPTPTPRNLDPRFPTCKKAKAAGYGDYRKGIDPEYGWYRDGDNDGVVCERGRPTTTAKPPPDDTTPPSPTPTLDDPPSRPDNPPPQSPPATTPEP